MEIPGIGTLTRTSAEDLVIQYCPAKAKKASSGLSSQVNAVHETLPAPAHDAVALPAPPAPPLVTPMLERPYVPTCRRKPTARQFPPRLVREHIPVTPWPSDNSINHMRMRDPYLARIVFAGRDADEAWRSQSHLGRVVEKVRLRHVTQVETLLQNSAQTLQRYLAWCGAMSDLRCLLRSSAGISCWSMANCGTMGRLLWTPPLWPRHPLSQD